MRPTWLVACCVVAAAANSCTTFEGSTRDTIAGKWKIPDEFMGVRDQPPEAPCPPGERRVVEIREADPHVDKVHHDLMRKRLVEAVLVPNTTVLLGPNVVLDFSDAPEDQLPISIRSCVTLMSVSSFPPDRPSTVSDVAASAPGATPATAAAA